MGNVYASSKPVADSLPPLPSMEMPVKNNLNEVLENPGSMEDLHKKCKELFPLNFEGAKICVQKVLSNHFQVSHTLNLSSLTPSGYRFGATYVGMKQYGPSDSYPVLIGDIDPNGNLNANVFHKFSESVFTKFQAQIQNSSFTAGTLITDYKGSNYTASLTLANINILQDSGFVVGHYLQSVTKRLALGTEMVYQRGPQIPGNQMSMVSLAGRYSGDDYSVSGTISPQGVHLCYYQKASDQLQLGVEWETNVSIQESVASVCYQIDLPKANLIFKGMVDSNWNVGATLEKRLAPLPFSLTMSGLLNHNKNQFRIGLGFIIAE